MSFLYANETHYNSCLAGVNGPIETEMMAPLPRRSGSLQARVLLAHFYSADSGQALRLPALRRTQGKLRGVVPLHALFSSLC